MKIGDNIHIIKHNLQNKAAASCLDTGFIYSLILFGEKITLVNAGPVGGERQVFEYIEKHNRKISDIDTLILTHAKMDFIGAAPVIKHITNCTVVAHYEDCKNIESLILQNSYFNQVENAGLLKVNYPVDGHERFTFGDKLDVDLIYSTGLKDGNLTLYFSSQKIMFSENISITSYKNEGVFPKNIAEQSELEILITPYHEPLKGPFIKQVA